LGFMLVAPGVHQLAGTGDLIYLAYSFDPEDSSDETTDHSDDSD